MHVFLCIQVIDGECYLAYLKVEAADMKQMRALKTASPMGGS